MKFWAKVKFKGEKNVEYLIRAFFKEFNPESSIVIRGNEGIVEVVFEKPPVETIDAIGHCEVIEFNYGKALEESYGKTHEEPVQVALEENVTVESEKNPEDSEVLQQPEEEKEVLEELKQPEPENEVFEENQHVVKEQPKSKQERNRRNVVFEDIKVPELDDFAGKATSFENFLELTAEWLDMGSNQEFFKQLVTAFAEVKENSVSAAEGLLKSRNVEYTPWTKISCSNKISKKLKQKYSITMARLLNIMKQYKDYEFKGEQPEECLEEEAVITEETPAEELVIEEENPVEATSLEAESEVVEEMQLETEEIIPQDRGKMKCMPKIPDFEEKLENLDMTQSIEERVSYVLNAMGLKKKSADIQRKIFEIANTAVRLSKISMDSISVMVKISPEAAMEARMFFAEFINDFVKKYDSERKIKLLDFLKDLQKIIMFESEIDCCTDFEED